MRTYFIDLNRLRETKGKYCPCKIKKDIDTICPCKDFVTTGKCVCSIFKEVNYE